MAAQQQLLPLGDSFELSDRSLQLAPGAKPDIDQCGEAAGKLKAVRGALKYWVGDFVRIVESLHGELASQVIDAEFMDEKEISDCRFVAERVAPDVRRLAPSWDHARAVAKLKPKEQEKWLQQALDGDWIAGKLKSEIAKDAAGGETAVKFLVVVDCRTEAKQKELQKRLTEEGFVVTTRESVRKERKGKDGEAKATKKKGSPRAYQPRRKKGSK